MSLVIAGQKFPVFSSKGKIPSVDFLEDSKYRLAPTGYRKRRTNWVRGITLHTRMGMSPQPIIAGGRSRRWDELVSSRWKSSERMVGAHIAIDGDGSFGCLADLLHSAAFHAGQVNEYSVGIEIYQEADGKIYQDSLETALYLVDTITRLMGIQRQFCAEKTISVRFATPIKASVKATPPLAYVPGGREGRDFVGVYGHRNCTRNRGQGDPGNAIFEMLEGAGYEKFRVDTDEDREIWVTRQIQCGMDEKISDGIPGPATVGFLSKIKKHGLWVSRPGD